MSFLRAIALRTIQTVRSSPREVENNAGGFVYAIDPWTRLDRFLTIGTENGTYYVGQRDLTLGSVSVIEQLITEDANRVVARIAEISRGGRAAKQDYGIFALALCASSANQTARASAYQVLPEICRTASTLFQFLSYLKGRRGWSRGLRSAIARWYANRSIDSLAYQMVKYQNRNGYSHRDVLRLAHASPAEDRALSALFAWAVGKSSDDELPKIVCDFEAAKQTGASRALARVLPREALPTEWLSDPEVWDALLFGDGDRGGMPLTAMIRNLGVMSRVGLLTATSHATQRVVRELSNVDRLAKARVHPISLYLAAKTYVLGRGVRGSGEWAPVGAIVDALERAFEAALATVTSTGQELLIAVDSSGSMEHPALGLPNVSAREISMATAFVMARTEPKARLIGFTDGSNTAEFKVAGDERLRDLIVRFEATVKPLGTDCAVPMGWAREKKFAPDGIVIFTDSETWAGNTKVVDSLADLRRSTGKATKMVTAATTATQFDVVDPKDPHAMGVAGFDAMAPQLIANFLSA